MARFLLLVLATVASVGTAWMTMSTQKPQPIASLQSRMKTFAATTAISASIILGTISGAQAVDFTGSYSDPNHPGCPRLIAVEETTAIINGADGNPGCPTGNGNPWRLIGKTSEREIFVDFSPKGGPKDLKGVWEEATNPGIRWPDGNKWTLQGKPN